MDVRVTAVASADYAAVCRRVLLASTHGCVFGDILERSYIDKSDFAQLATVEDRIRHMAQGGIWKKAWCYRHHRYCKCPHTDIDISGSPCTAHSRIGRRAGGLDPNFQCLLTWANAHIKSQTPILIHENVVGFEFSLVESIFGRHYHCTRLKVCTGDVGFSKLVRRVRYYDVLVHKSRAQIVTPLQQLYDHVIAAFREHIPQPELTQGSFLLASESEIEDATGRIRASRRAGSCSDPLQSYTDKQCKNLRVYKTQFKKQFGGRACKRALFHLNDNPKKRIVWSGRDGCLPTIRKAMGPIHSMEVDRQVTAREAMTAMGFVVFEDLAVASGLEQTLPEDFVGSPGTMSCLGNAMHQTNCSVVLAVTLAATRPFSKYERAFHDYAA